MVCKKMALKREKKGILKTDNGHSMPVLGGGRMKAVGADVILEILRVILEIRTAGQRRHSMTS